MRSEHHVSNSREPLASLTLTSLLTADCAVSQLIYPVLWEARIHFNRIQELSLVLRFYLFAYVISQTAVTFYQYRDFFFPLSPFLYLIPHSRMYLAESRAKWCPLKAPCPTGLVPSSPLSPTDIQPILTCFAFVVLTSYGDTSLIQLVMLTG